MLEYEYCSPYLLQLDIGFTSSTSFANPTVTIARIFTDTFTGINPSFVVYFINWSNNWSFVS